jgi:ribonuclease-3
MAASCVECSFLVLENRLLIPDGPPPIEEVIGYQFKDSAYLKEALSHKSFACETKTGVCNERLEFLGDSILAAVVAHRLYEEYPKDDEGSLSKKKSALVSRLSLSRWAVNINLGAYLYLGVGEESSGGRARQSLLGNALEALIGAVYLDGGYQAAKGFIGRLLEREGQVEDADYKSELQEYAQKDFRVVPVYEVTAATGPEHDKTFEVAVRVGKSVYGLGRGKNKKEAEQRAAHEALDLVKEKRLKKAHGG